MRQDITDMLRFIHGYCSHMHSRQEKTPFLHPEMKKELPLCPDCYSLANYSIARKVTCSRNEPNGCRKCTVMCFTDEYKVKFNSVMKFSQFHYLLHRRLDIVLRYFML